MAQNKARVAVIGTGWWATYAHIPGLKDYEHADLVALCDSDPARLNSAAQRYEIERTYSDVGEMLEAEELDGAVVATTPVTHYEVAKACLEHGLHIMIEKPLVQKSAEARELLRVAEKNGSKEIIVGYPWHFTGHTLRARKLVQAGELGDIQFVSSVFASMVIEFYRENPAAYRPVHNYPVHGPSKGSISDPNIAGGGQGQQQITHSSALMFWVSGQRARNVSAFMRNFDVSVDLVDAVSVQFGSGAVGTVGSTGNIGVGDAGQHDLSVYGSKAYLLMKMIDGTTTVQYHDGHQVRFDQLPEVDRYPRFATARNLVDVIVGRDINRSPGEVGMRTVEFLEASYRSAARGGALVPVEQS